MSRRTQRKPQGLAYTVRCPECGAAAGKFCWRRRKPHQQRLDAARLKATGSTRAPEPMKVTHADGSVEVRTPSEKKPRARPGAKGRYAATASVARDRAQQAQAATRQQELKAAFLARQQAREAEAETPRGS